MAQTVTEHPNGTFDLHLACDYCGKPVVTSGASGMTCEDRCADKWVRWDRLGRPGFQKHLKMLGGFEAAMAERETLRALLFREDGTPKFSGKF